MSGSKRYALIPLTESSACEASFEQMEAAWQSGDVDRIGIALAGLKPHFIYSNYPWYQRWNELSPQVVRALWRGWPREKFWAIEKNQNLSSWEFRNALEPLADELSADDLRALCEQHDFPNKDQQTRLWERLVEEEGDDFSRWLIHKIETDLNDAERLKAAQTDVSQSPFHVFHWQRWHPDVITPIRILAYRRDTVARNQTREWLHTLPFANDQNSVRALLEGASHQNYPELESDLEHTLERFATPTDLRLLLLEFLDKLNSRAALTHFFADLRGSMDERGREGYLQDLEGHLSFWKKAHEPLLLREIETVQIAKWSFLMRGFWLSLTSANRLVVAQSPDVGARCADKLVRFFDTTRPGCWGGCLMGAPLLVLLGAAFQWGCTLLLGKPAPPWDALNLAFTFLWAICASVTATSDFQHGDEPRRTRFKMALCSFSSLAVLIIVSIASRMR